MVCMWMAKIYLKTTYLHADKVLAERSDGEFFLVHLFCQLDTMMHIMVKLNWLEWSYKKNLRKYFLVLIWFLLQHLLCLLGKLAKKATYFQCIWLTFLLFLQISLVFPLFQYHQVLWK